MRVDRERMQGWVAAGWDALVQPRLGWVDLVPAAAVTWLAWQRVLESRGGARPFPDGPDAGLWVEAAVGVFHGDADLVAAQGRPPGYPAVVALAYALGGEALQAPQMVSLASFALLFGALWLAGAAVAGRLGAVAAVALAWWARPLATAAAMINSQALYNFALTLFLAVGPALLARPGVGSRVGLGLLAGGLVLVKEQGIPAAAFTGLVAVAMGAHRAGPGRRVRGAVVEGAWTALGMIVALVPLGWLAWVEYGLGGRLPKMLLPLSDFLTSRGLPNPLAHLSGAGLPPSDPAHGIAADAAIGGKALDAFLELLGPVPLYVAAAALPALWARRGRAVWAAVFLAPLGPALALGFFYPYHVSFLVVPMVVLVAAGLSALLPPARLLFDGRWWQRLGGALGVGAAVVLGWEAFLATTPDRDQLKWWTKDLVGDWAEARSARAWAIADRLRAELPPGAWMASTLPAMPRAAGAVPVDVGATPLNPSHIRGRPGEVPCDVWIVYGVETAAKYWAWVRLQPPNQVPLGWEYQWHAGGGRGPNEPIVVARLRGPRPDDPRCAPSHDRLPVAPVRAYQPLR